MENPMFCNQCQETAGNTGCTRTGVCGKTPDTANLQDILLFLTECLAEVLTAMRKSGEQVSSEINRLIRENLFMTVTNVNFDNEAIINKIGKTIACKNDLIKNMKNVSDISEWAMINVDVNGLENLLKYAKSEKSENEDERSLKSLITCGLKGLAAYLYHCDMLGKEKDEIDAFLQYALSAVLNESKTADMLPEPVMETGKYGIETMALLDIANTEAYGNPDISSVSLNAGSNPGILVSGHDLKDLEMLLEAAEGSGIDIYTHSEMLPAHYYPFFKKYKHFIGNYGGAWHNQKADFQSFGGPILITSNCLIPPKESYKDRVYTTGAAGFAGVKHIKGGAGDKKDFSGIIEHAKKCPPPEQKESGSITGGFPREQTARKLADYIKSGMVKKIVVMAGCDGRNKSRSYYSEFAEKLPEDTVILTAGCVKYRFNKLDLGNIGEIPRILDAGQCSDFYSIITIILKLKELLEIEDINDLPVVYNIAWYEQKSVTVLLSMLYLGIKNIVLGPDLPAFLSPNTVNMLINSFGIRNIGSVENDLRLFFGNDAARDAKINSKMLVGDILKAHGEASKIFAEFNMQCLGCPASQAETLKDACEVHGIDANLLLQKLND